MTSYAPLEPSRGRLRKSLRTRTWRVALAAQWAVLRLVEVLLGLIGLVLTAALLPFVAILRRGKSPFVPIDFVGRHGDVRRAYAFAYGPSRLRGLPAALNMLRGELALVGPRPLSPREVVGLDPHALRRMDVRPGAISLYKLRKQTNIAFDDEFKTDREYVEKSGLKGDLGLVARYVTTAWASEETLEYQAKLDLLGVPIDNLTMREAVEMIVQYGQSESPKRICFVNADCINLTFRSQAYARTLIAANSVLADGIGVKLAGKLLKRPIIQNVNGTDLFPRLCERLAGTDQSIFLLGGREGVADGVRDWVASHHPETKIAGVQHGFFSEDQLGTVKAAIKASGATILLVAFGAPKQDTWIAEHMADLGVGVSMGVGGLFDFYSDRISRAPQWMRELGLEWVYRLVQEPGRMWKRYLVGNVVFLYRVVRFGKRGRRIE